MTGGLRPQGERQQEHLIFLMKVDGEPSTAGAAPTWAALEPPVMLSDL